MLFKLSLKNIQKSIKDYAIYFITLILGVAIFYVFNSIESQTVLLNVTSSTRDIIELMTTMLSGVSVFVSFILGFLIIYASRFLMKKRNREFGIYLTLGMSKRKIAMILFFETILIGIISLIVGLGLGILLSQLMSLFVANMFEADMTQFTFIFSGSAMFKTLLYFGIMYVLVMLFNTSQVQRCKLIDLIHSNKKQEEVKMKNPYICVAVFLLAAIALGYAYYMVTVNVNNLQYNQVYIPIILGSLATFFIFWSLSGLILKIVMGVKNLYYKGLNSFTLRQVSSKINTTVFGMTTICLMLFITICVLSSALSMRNSMNANLDELAAADIEIYKTRDLDPSDYSLDLVEDSKITVLDSLERLDFNYNQYFKDIILFDTYATNDLTYGISLGEEYEQAKQEYPMLNYDYAEEIVKIGDYNKVASLYGLSTYELDDDEYMIIANFDNMLYLRNNALKRGTTITLNNKVLKPKYQECQDGFIHLSNSHTNQGIILVPDSLDLSDIKERNILIANYNTDDASEKEKIEQLILSLDTKPYADSTNLQATSKISLYEASVGLGSMVTFIGLYLGIIFLISSAAILALKELSESADSKERYMILRKIGADEKLINNSLFRQIAIFFAFPLILALIHSIFGIKFCNYILATFGKEEMLKSVGLTALFIIAIYGAYFLITYYCSKNIIKDSK